MARTTKVVVAGGGVAGLASALHLVEIFRAREAAGRDDLHLELDLIAPLVPHAGSEGSGLGGKAMSRSFEGRYDDAHGGIDRRLFYGPMMPEAGTIPHGYHILWGYPNLRRLLRQPGEDDSLGGLLRPPPRYDGDRMVVPGGAALIPSFQALLDDPAPGGPGIGLMGLVDPEHPESATRPITRELLALRDTGAAGPFLRAWARLFGAASGDIDPFTFADLFYAHEVDLELRVTLILASLTGRRLDPERATVVVDGVERPLTEVEYDAWARELATGWAREVGIGPDGTRQLLLDVLDLGWLIPDWLPGAAALEARIRAWVEARVAQVEAAGPLLEATWEASDLPDDLISLLPDGIEARLRRYLAVYLETERVVRALPAAAVRLAQGDYPVWRTLHFRFAPDATFASPHSFDAAQAVRSLQLCFINPRWSRMWSPDGAKIQRLWLRLWRRLEAEAAACPLVTLRAHEGRVHALRETSEGVEVTWGYVLGHGTTGPHDLGYPHHSSLAAPPPPGSPTTRIADAVIPAMPPGLLAPLLRAGSPAREAAAALASRAGETLEILVWLPEVVDWSPAARAGLANASITGLEGPFCLLADYRAGLWSEDALGRERPFGPDHPFGGSILESCGSMLDLFACLDRDDDAYGWPREAKEAIAALLFDPRHVGERDPRRWAHVDGGGWEQKVAVGTWTDARVADPASFDDWVVASRWLAWGWLRQLSRIKSLGERATRQLGFYAALLDPRHLSRTEILDPPAELRATLRYVVMRNANRRNRFVNPGVGDWPLRPVSGAPLTGTARVFPAGDWTRNGLDVMCMEGATLSGMRAARGVHARLAGALPDGVPDFVRVLPEASWYVGLDPMERPGVPVGVDAGGGEP